MPLQDSRVELGTAALSFAAGVALLQLLPGLPPLWPVLATTAGLLLVVLRWRHLWWLGVSATGFAWALLHACAVLCEHLPVEWENRDLFRKRLVAHGRIRAGESFNADNVAVKRSNRGLSPMRYWTLLGTAATRDYQPDEGIEE